MASRRTILPWFVGVQEDGETLDNPESDKWSDLAVGYASQTPVKLTPSGLSNRYGPIPYKFPPATQLLLPAPVSQALVCKTSWADPAVQVHANLLLGGDRTQVVDDIALQRVKALRAFNFSRVKTIDPKALQ